MVANFKARPTSSVHCTEDRTIADSRFQKDPHRPGARASCVKFENLLFKRNTLSSLLAAMLSGRSPPLVTDTTSLQLSKHPILSS